MIMIKNKKLILLSIIGCIISPISLAANVCINYSADVAIYENGYNAIDIELGNVIPAITLYDGDINNPDKECYTTDHFSKSNLPYINISTINLLANIYNSHHNKKVNASIYVVED